MKKYVLWALLALPFAAQADTDPADEAYGAIDYVCRQFGDLSRYTVIMAQVGIPAEAALSDRVNLDSPWIAYMVREAYTLPKLEGEQRQELALDFSKLMQFDCMQRGIDEYRQKGLIP